ncbi:hypothetical protein, partial [Pseudomonas syringae group genomosp. 7]|uniref:hypothetical protein n=1 Tax=Pseudomonas syringae group genomosp. 7 TaxID=251699 RepID=UPI00377018F1
NSELASKVRAFNARNRLTLNKTIKATQAVRIYRNSGQHDLRIGAPLANRIRPESEGLIGAIHNTQQLRVQHHGQMTDAQLFEQ